MRKYESPDAKQAFYKIVRASSLKTSFTLTAFDDKRFRTYYTLFSDIQILIFF